MEGAAFIYLKRLVDQLMSTSRKKNVLLKRKNTMSKQLKEKQIKIRKEMRRQGEDRKGMIRRKAESCQSQSTN